MQQQEHNPEILIQWSQDWWFYMVARGGFLRFLVNMLEDTLAITGRTLLLVFLLYCGVKSGAMLVAPTWKPDLWLEMTMFVMQLAGLEGSLPGLSRHAEELRTKGDEPGAVRVEHIMNSARIMTILTIGEGVLHLIFGDGTIQISGHTIHSLQIVSGILLFVRGWVIISFLMELAKIQSKGPRVLSKEAYEQEQAMKATQSEQGQLIATLQKDLRQAQQERHDMAAKLVNAEMQMKEIESQQMKSIQAYENQGIALENLQTHLANVEGDRNILSANLETANLQIADMAKKLETANQRLVKLQNAEREPAKSAPVQTAQPAKSTPAKSAKQTKDLQNVTSIDEARAKHNAGTQKATHEDVLAFMAEHSDLKNAEVAQQLGISERKVYNALAWQREQQNAVSSAQ